MEVRRGNGGGDSRGGVLAGGKSLHPRVFTGNGHELLALDGDDGEAGGGWADGRFQLLSPPAVLEDVVMTGSDNGEGAPTIGAYGDMRGWDAGLGCGAGLGIP